MVSTTLNLECTMLIVRKRVLKKGKKEKKGKRRVGKGEKEKYLNLGNKHKFHKLGCIYTM